MGLREISPLDGRYASKVAELRDHVSEWGLMRRRVQVEVEWLLVLAPQLDGADLRRLSTEFDDSRAVPWVRRNVLDKLPSPADPAWRSRRITRPDLLLICDVSGSVAAFTRFTLLLVACLQVQFPRIRSFLFIDTVDEVTRYFGPGVDFNEALGRIATEAEAVWLDGHSDYGSVLEEFHDEYGNDIGPKTTLLILGDARTNYRARKAGALKALADRAHHTYWLNPEPIGDWDIGDSAASDYAAQVDKMVEVRNLKQLQEFIATEL